MSEEEKSARIVKLIKDSAKPARRTRPQPVPVGSGTVVIVNASGQAQGAGRDIIHNHINEKTVTRPRVVRGPEFISSAGARKIQLRIEALVKMGVAAGGDQKRLYARWHKQLKDFFNVPSYLSRNPCYPRTTGHRLARSTKSPATAQGAPRRQRTMARQLISWHMGAQQGTRYVTSRRVRLGSQEIRGQGDFAQAARRT